MLYKIMQYRGIDLSTVRKEQKQFYYQMQKMYALPTPKHEQEAEEELLKILKNGGKLPKSEGQNEHNTIATKANH